MHKKEATSGQWIANSLKYLNAILLGLAILSLIGCYFPQPTRTPMTGSDQHKTEVAGILNPTQLESTAAEDLQPLISPSPIESINTEQPTLATLKAPEGYLLYTTQQGDTHAALASRFGVAEYALEAQGELPSTGFLPLGTLVHIPDVLEDTLPNERPIFPDSEVTYSPSVGDFDTVAYAQSAGGYLASHTEMVKEKRLSGPEIVYKVALETSTNPRLLLAILEYQSGWVLGHPTDAEQDLYPIGFGAAVDTGLYKELMIAAKVLAQGFYGWREGSLVSLSFYGGESGRLSPNLNAGSVALMRVFAAIYRKNVWEDVVFNSRSFLDFYHIMFGDYWMRAAAVEPYLVNGLEQPFLTLPFGVGERWSLTGGPHSSWQTGTPFGAIDFAPITGEPACAVSTRWARASAPGLVVRSSDSVVALDLDGDGDEGTGWVLIYQHVAEQDRVKPGTWLAQDDPIGHPSCEGGQASGTHLHFTRKFNGEWVGVGQPLPLQVSGWRVVAGERRYEGYLQKGESVVTANPNGMSGSTIIRQED